MPDMKPLCIRFLPWVGKNYGEPNYPSLLIVGESHYDWTDRAQPEADITRTVVQEWAIEKRSPFFRKIVAICRGELPKDLETQREFWDSVAFYNYVQEFAGDGPRQRPNLGMWPRSEEAFRTVLDKLHPKLILVLGRQNWENMPKREGSAGELLKSIDGPYSYTWFYPAAVSGHALAFHVMHPSSPGFNYRRFVGLFNEAKSRVHEL